MQVLLVEDDQTLFQELKKELEHWDFFVTGIDDFSAVMDIYEETNPEIVIMDVQLPFYDGFYWCRKIRQVSNVPILFLSSRDNPMDQVMSMELGADDYMQKPFHTSVLIAKLQAIYRRVYEFGAEEKRTLNWQDALVDLSKDSIQKGDSVIYLSKTEMIILEMLIQKQNQIVTRDTLITALWDDEAFVSDNTLTVNVNRLRKKLSDIGMDTQIETKVGKGYMAHE
ncbi:response regulator transcription factor GraR/ApsR [Staphylococcus sp. HMSC062C03]|uniref:response regulator transcription factor GraR/ApsR n=1 Tax=Staphylococcus sp. HMSC062C03 TaxID=1715178 RepID=UPI0008A89EC2|nr:response regulator transcription factor GraR/ApsR [Staphylococcus sp. HMSC062C03]OHP68429.1 DNA-binding response regulator [Staphylococcus sp. HMSC062C03]